MAGEFFSNISSTFWHSKWAVVRAYCDLKKSLSHEGLNSAIPTLFIDFLWRLGKNFWVYIFIDFKITGGISLKKRPTTLSFFNQTIPLDLRRKVGIALSDKKNNFLWRRRKNLHFDISFFHRLLKEGPVFTKKKEPTRFAMYVLEEYAVIFLRIPWQLNCPWNHIRTWLYGIQIRGLSWRVQMNDSLYYKIDICSSKQTQLSQTNPLHSVGWADGNFCNGLSELTNEKYVRTK